MEKKKYNAPDVKIKEIELQLLTNSADAGGGNSGKDDAKPSSSSSFDMSYTPETPSTGDDTNN